jgi:hypothetical protein
MMMRLALAKAKQGRRNGHTERTTVKHCSRPLLVVATALPLGACFLTAEEIAANEDAACRSAAAETENPFMSNPVREDRSKLRVAQIAEVRPCSGRRGCSKR